MLNLFKRDHNKAINVNDMDNLLGSINLIDVREPYEFHNTSLKTAKNIPMGNLLSDPVKFLKKDTLYYIICQSGARSSRTCSILTKQGYDVINVSGGMGSYAGSMRK
jgi:rhodanese-related sulfurtransferase